MAPRHRLFTVFYGTSSIAVGIVVISLPKRTGALLRWPYGYAFLLFIVLASGYNANATLAGYHIDAAALLAVGLMHLTIFLREVRRVGLNAGYAALAFYASVGIGLSAAGAIMVEGDSSAGTLAVYWTFLAAGLSGFGILMSTGPARY